MCRRSCLGCLTVFAVLFLCGGLSLALAWNIAGRIAGEPPQEPVSVAGDCPEEATQAFIRERGSRLKRVLGPINDFGTGASREPESPEEALSNMENGMQSVSLAELEALRTIVEGQPVPACAEDLKQAELDLYTMVAGVLAYGQRDDRPVLLRSQMVVLALLRGTAPYLTRVSEGHDRLAQRLGYVDADALDLAVEQDPPTSPFQPSPITP